MRSSALLFKIISILQNVASVDAFKTTSLKSIEKVDVTEDTLTLLVQCRYPFGYIDLPSGHIKSYLLRVNHSSFSKIFVYVLVADADHTDWVKDGWKIYRGCIK